jgi:hypothetical protein
MKRSHEAKLLLVVLAIASATVFGLLSKANAMYQEAAPTVMPPVTHYVIEKQEGQIWTTRSNGHVCSQSSNPSSQGRTTEFDRTTTERSATSRSRTMPAGDAVRSLVAIAHPSTVERGMKGTIVLELDDKVCVRWSNNLQDWVRKDSVEPDPDA